MWLFDYSSGSTGSPRLLTRRKVRSGATLPSLAVPAILSRCDYMKLKSEQNDYLDLKGIWRASHNIFLTFGTGALDIMYISLFPSPGPVSAWHARISDGSFTNTTTPSRNADASCRYSQHSPKQHNQRPVDGTITPTQRLAVKILNTSSSCTNASCVRSGGRVDSFYAPSGTKQCLHPPCTTFLMM